MHFRGQTDSVNNPFVLWRCTDECMVPVGPKPLISTHKYYLWVEISGFRLFA